MKSLILSLTLHLGNVRDVPTHSLISFHPAARGFEVDTSTPLLELLAAAPPTGGCEQGELGEVIAYLKRSEHLKLPLDWCPYV